MSIDVITVDCPDCGEPNPVRKDDPGGSAVICQACGRPFNWKTAGKAEGGGRKS